MPPAPNSKCWVYFKRDETTPARANCMLCGQSLSRKGGGTTALRNHLRSKHPNEFQSLFIDDPNTTKLEFDLDTKPFTDHSDSDESTTLEPDNELWGFFDKEPRNRARCSMCGTVLKRDTDVLYKHLKEQHSRISENLEFKDNEESYTEVIYLEDPVGDHTEPKKPKFEQKIEEFKPKRPKRRYSYREPLRVNNNQEPVKKIDKHEQEIDNFGKYITGLLKGVPRNDCNKLQMDIVNLIMTSKLNNSECTPTITINGTIEMQSENEHTVEENTTMDEDRENQPAEDSQPDSKTDPRKDPDIPRPKKRPKTLSYKDDAASNLTEHGEKEVENFGNYITCLLQSVTNKDIGSKLQMDIVNLIMTARLRGAEKCAPSAAINQRNNETTTET